jgi:hypothetical protein
MKLLSLFFSISLMVITTKNFSQKYTIYGSVRDSANGETLIGASLIIKENNNQAITNNYGFYSVTLSKGHFTIFCNYMGYSVYSKEFELSANLKLDILMTPHISTLNEVIIKAGKTNVTYNLTSRNNLSIDRIKSIVSATGEPDVLKSLQMLPGIQTSNEGSTNLNIRGGSYDQNLILLDEAPVYNPSHALGLFSTFNTDAIKNVTVYKGAFPAQYGGRLSSVIDITMKDGNVKKISVNGGVGLLASRLSIEGPIAKEKSSFIISARYGYAGQTLNLLAGELGHDLIDLYSLRNFSSNNKINFYDLNAKFNLQVDSRNRIYLSAYTGRDIFYSFPLNNENSLEWGNTTGTFRWNHIFNRRLFSNFTIYYSNYNYSYFIKEDIRSFDWKSNIKETGLKADLNAFFSPQLNLKFGFFSIYHFFSPGNIEPRGENSVIRPISLDNKNCLETGLYINNEQVIADKLTLSYGLRYSAFMDIGSGIVYKYNESMSQVIDSISYRAGEIIHIYQGLEPRVSVNYSINNNNSVKIAYAFTKQYLHLLSNSTVGLPTDTWLPPDNYIKPETSNQYIIGFYRLLHNGDYEFTAEFYYKTLSNIIDFKDNADLFMNKHIETQILQGTGVSYGSEYLLEKKSGRITGWLGYTLAKTKYKINGINEDNTFSPRYDIRHNISLTGNYKLNKKWALSITFKYTSGGFITIPDGVYVYDGASFYYYSSRNGYQLPPYHRLDFSLTYNNPKNESRKWKSEWILGIYNIYNRKNVYSLYIRQDGYDLSSSTAYKMYLYGIVPTISYNFKF